MISRTVAMRSVAFLLLLLPAGTTARAEPPDRRPPCRGADCVEVDRRVSRVDLDIQFRFLGAVETLNNGKAEHVMGLLVTIPDQGRFHLREIARLGVSARLARIFLVGEPAEGAVHIEVRAPGGGSATVGVCYTTPAPQCEVALPLGVVTSTGPGSLTFYDAVKGRYAVRVIYADGERRNLVFFTDTY